MRSTYDTLGLEVVSDYGPRSPARWSQPWSSATVKALTALGALLVGFLLASGVNAGREAAEAQDARKAELIELVNARQERTAALGSQLEELRAAVATTEIAAAQAGAPVLNDRVALMEEAAGLTPVEGPGVRVTFSDSAGPCSTNQPQDCRIQDADLQQAVNLLFAAGAEAATVNGERVIATTAIRSAGTTILVNYQLLVSPYVIEAVGDPEVLAERFASSQLATDFVEFFRDIYGLGYEIAEVEELALPAYSGTVSLGTASRAGGGGTP